MIWQTEPASACNSPCTGEETGTGRTGIQVIRFLFYTHPEPTRRDAVTPRLLSAALLALMPFSVQADTVRLPDDYAQRQGSDLFRLCRAAILIELRADEETRSSIPRNAVEAMREQMDFLMADTIFSAPVLNMEDAQKRLDFTERFILDFGKTVGSESERLKDPEKRAGVLIGCQPLLWSVMKERLEYLLQWRRKAMGLDGDFPALNGPSGGQ